MITTAGINIIMAQATGSLSAARGSSDFCVVLTTRWRRTGLPDLFASHIGAKYTATSPPLASISTAYHLHHH